MEVTNVDQGSVTLEGGEYGDELLTFGAAGTVKAGTILARSTATAKLVPFVKGGAAAGNGIPNTVVPYDVTASAAGDVPIRAMLSGTVRKERLVIAADGDDTNVDAVIIDQLRARSIVTVNATELAKLDNQ